MSSILQTITALAIVALVATWFVLRALAKRKTPGCGGDCGCTSQKISATLNRR